MNYPIEFLNSLEPAGKPPKVVSLVILLRNMIPQELCNGTQIGITWFFYKRKYKNTYNLLCPFSRTNYVDIKKFKHECVDSEIRIAVIGYNILIEINC